MYLVIAERTSFEEAELVMVAMPFDWAEEAGHFWQAEEDFWQLSASAGLDRLEEEGEGLDLLRR